MPERNITLGPAPSHQPFWGGTLLTNALTAGRVHVHYLKQAFFPMTLVGDYSFDAFPASASADLASVLSLAAVLGLAQCLIRASRARISLSTRSGSSSWE